MLRRRYIILRLVIAAQLAFPPSVGWTSAVEEVRPALLLKSQTRLYDKLVKSVGARLDEIGPLKEALSQSLKETDENAKSLIWSKAEFLLSEGSLSPEIFIRYKERLTFSQEPLTPDHPSFQRLKEICENLRMLSEDARTKGSSLGLSLQKLKTLYDKYIQTFCDVSYDQRNHLLSFISIRENVFGTSLGISKDRAYHLLSLDEFGVVAKTNVLGSSAVTKVGEVYVKKNLIKSKQGPGGTSEEQAQKALEGTLDPGMEGAVSLFHEIFFGRGMVSSCLLCLPHVPHLEPLKGTEAVHLINELKDSRVGGPRKETIRDRLAGERELQHQFKAISKPYVCQVTEGVEGEMLGDFLRQALKEPSLFKKLDMPQVQKMILSQMLTRPADAKDDNLMAAQTEKGFQIIGIDNDLSFCSPIVQLAPNYHALEMRSLLFVLPALMDEPLLPEVQAYVLRLSPVLKTLEWLQALGSQNQGYETLIAQGALSLEEAALLKLPFKLKEGEALRITRAMNALQTQAKTYPDSTLRGLLRAISPLEALYYETLVASEKDPLKAFDKIYKQSVSLEDILGQETIQGAYPAEGLYKQRDQTIEGAIHELLDKIEISSIDSVTPLLEGVFKLGLSYFKNPQTVSRGWKESRLLWRALGEQAPLPVIQSLLNLTTDSAYHDPQTLRHIVHQGAMSNASPEVLFALVQALSLEDRERMLNSEDQEGKTPLDYAFLSDHPSGVAALIELGAWCCATHTALEFYKTNIRSQPKTPLGEAFLKLMRLNLAVDWEVRVEEMFPCEEGNNPVETGLWESSWAVLLSSKKRLYDKLVKSLNARPDEIGKVKAALGQAFEKATEANQSLVRSKAGFVISSTSLLPETFVRFKEQLILPQVSITPTHHSFERLKAHSESLQTLSEHGQIKGTHLASSLQQLRNLYEKYILTFCGVSFEQRIPLLSFVPIRENVFGSPLGISKEMTYYLLSLDEFGVISKTNTSGSSAVTPVGEVYVKKNLLKSKQSPEVETEEGHLQKAMEGTLDPGMEAAVGTFHTLFFGEGMVASCLLCLPHVPHQEPCEGTEAIDLLKSLKDSHVGHADKEGIRDRLGNEDALKAQFKSVTKPYVCQVTEGIEGESLGEFLKKALAEPSLFKTLDGSQVQKIILSHMLTRPADAKEDNLMVTQGKKGLIIVGIDNDLSFCSPIVCLEPDRHVLEARSLLFAIPALMNELVLSDVRDSFLELSPILKVLEWLQALEHQNEGYAKLMAQGILNSEEASLLKLPFQLREGEALRIVRTMKMLQERLKNYPNSTLNDLLKVISPLESLYYEKILSQERDPLKAFDKIYKQIVPLEKALDSALLGGPYPVEGLYKQRTQSIKSSIKELLSTRDVFASDPLTPILEGVFKQVPRYFKESSPLAPLWKESGFLWRALREKAPLSIIKTLLSFKPKVDSPDPYTLRHVLHQGASNRVSEDILQALVQTLPLEERAKMLNSEDREGKTPLDHAFLADHPQGVRALIEFGSWTCAADLALKFYKTTVRSHPNTSLGKAFLKLMRLNLAVDWEVSLEEMLPSVEGKKAPQAMIMTSASHGKRLLSQGIKDQILNPNGELKRSASSGNHTVAYAQGKGPLKTHGLYFKAYPALPGLEEATGSLTRQLLGFGAPYSELVKIGNMPFLLSQEIPGETLLSVVKTRPQMLKLLDTEDTMGLILIALLINPEDGKPDNFIVTPHPRKEGVYRLVGIDNDQSFVPAIVREKPQKATFSSRILPIAQVKTILYCFNQMLEPVPHSLRSKFINIAPDQVLDKWLSHLRWVHTQYMEESLFSSTEQKICFKEKECFLGVPFQKGALSHLYEKMVYLRDLLFQYPSITPFELLSKLEPRLAKRYEEALRLSLSVEDRFKQVDQPFYEIRKDGSHTTMTKSGVILQSMNIPLQESILETIRDGQDFGPRQAIQELKEIKKMKAETALQGLAVRAGDKNFLKRLNLEETRAGFLKDLSRQGKILPPQQQTALLEYLSQMKDVRELILSHFTLLDDVWMQKLPLEHLRVLDLRMCSKLTNQTLILLSQKALGLEELNLGGMLKLKVVGKGIFNTPLLFSSLKILSFADCKNLTRIEIEAPLLSWVNLEGCSNLTIENQEAFIERNSKLITIKGRKSLNPNPYVIL